MKTIMKNLLSSYEERSIREIVELCLKLTVLIISCACIFFKICSWKFLILHFL